MIEVDVGWRKDEEGFDIWEREWLMDVEVGE